MVGMDARQYAIGEVAGLANVSVRTLHHYDEVGLLRPSARTAAGHRRYDRSDLDRLQQILFYRELEFTLDDIAAMLADPGSGTDDKLREQHRLLGARIARHQALTGALERQMEARRMGIALTPEEQFEIFGSDKVAGTYAHEAEQRWGDTDAWAQSQRRTATYTKDGWREIKAETDDITRDFAAALAQGVPATAPEATAIAERHRQHITRRFYDCSPSMHGCLAEMYVADPRFTDTFEQVAAGLAQYVHDAVMANTASHTS